MILYLAAFALFILGGSTALGLLLWAAAGDVAEPGKSEVAVPENVFKALTRTEDAPPRRKVG